MKTHLFLSSIILSLSIFVCVSIAQASSTTLCETLKADKRAANRAYQAALNDAKSYSGEDRGICEEYWTTYNEACNEYADANLIHWIRCIKPNIPTRIEKRTEQTALQGEMDAMIAECAMNLADARVEGCY